MKAAILIAASRAWPDAIDQWALLAFFAVTVFMPLFGYWLMVADFRAYLRALKGMLVTVTYYFPSVPAWARYETPGCLRALGLSLPCTPEDVRKAYHEIAKVAHPDRGGDPAAFMRLHRNVEESLHFLREHEADLRVDPAK